MLDCHSQIVGGGELHWLTTPDAGPDGVCGFCGGDCQYWSQQIREQISLDNLYDVTSRLFGKPFVADSSKMPDWFATVSQHNPELRFGKVLLFKHPYRLVASFLENSKADGNARFYTIGEILRHLCVLYNNCISSHKFDLFLRYEDLVLAPEASLRKVLATLDLASRTGPRRLAAGGTSLYRRERRRAISDLTGTFHQRVSPAKGNIGDPGCSSMTAIGKSSRRSSWI